MLARHHKVCSVPAYMVAQCAACARVRCAQVGVRVAGGRCENRVRRVSAAIFERDMRRHRHMPSDRASRTTSVGERKSRTRAAGTGVIWWTRCTLYAGFRRQEPRVSVVLHQHHAQHAKRRLDRGLDVLIVLICAEQRWHARGLGLERGFQP